MWEREEQSHSSNFTLSLGIHLSGVCNSSFTTVMGKIQTNKVTPIMYYQCGFRLPKSTPVRPFFTTHNDIYIYVATLGRRIYRKKYKRELGQMCKHRGMGRRIVKRLKHTYS